MAAGVRVPRPLRFIFERGVVYGYQIRQTCDRRLRRVRTEVYFRERPYRSWRDARLLSKEKEVGLDE